MKEIVLCKNCNGSGKGQGYWVRTGMEESDWIVPTCGWCKGTGRLIATYEPYK